MTFQFRYSIALLVLLYANLASAIYTVRSPFIGCSGLVTSIGAPWRIDLEESRDFQTLPPFEQQQKILRTSAVVNSSQIWTVDKELALALGNFVSLPDDTKTLLVGAIHRRFVPRDILKHLEYLTVGQSILSLMRMAYLGQLNGIVDISTSWELAPPADVERAMSRAVALVQEKNLLLNQPEWVFNFHFGMQGMTRRGRNQFQYWIERAEHLQHDACLPLHFYRGLTDNLDFIAFAKQHDGPLFEFFPQYVSYVWELQQWIGFCPIED